MPKVKEPSGMLILHNKTAIQTFKIDIEDYKEALRIGLAELIKRGKIKLSDIES